MQMRAKLAARWPWLRPGPTRFRVMDGAVLVAAAVLVAQAPLSVGEANWVPHLDPLPRLALGGLLIGYLVERSRLPASIGLLLGTLLGLELITWTFAQVALVGS